MIQIKKVSEIPFKNFSTYSAADYEAVKGLGVQIDKKSEAIYLVSDDDEPLLAVGILRQNLLNAPFVWVLLHENLEHGKVFNHLRALRTASIKLSQRYGKVQTSVETKWKTGRKFARFFGFKETKITFTVADREFILMET